MADKVTPGLGRFNVGQPSTENNPYLKLVEQAGNQLGNVGRGYAAAQIEIGRRKSAALELVPEADFTSDSAAAGLYGADAKDIEDKVNGVGEDAYDFSNVNDVARFKKDVASLNKELVEAEAIYNASIKNAQDLELSHSVFLETGENPEVDVNGVKVVNGKVEGQYFDVTMDAVYALRNAEGVKENGKYVLKDSNTGKVIRSYDTKQEYLEDLGYVTGADYKMAQVETPANVAITRRYGAMYDNKQKASSRIKFDVQNDLNSEANKWYAQTKGVDLKFVPTEVGEDGLTDPQRLYAEELMSEWTREQRTPTPTSGSGSVNPEDMPTRTMAFNLNKPVESPSDSDIGTAFMSSFPEETEEKTDFGVSLKKPIKVPASIFTDGSYSIFGFIADPYNNNMIAKIEYTPEEGVKYAYKTKDSTGIETIGYASTQDEAASLGEYAPENNISPESREADIVIGPSVEGIGAEIYRNIMDDNIALTALRAEEQYLSNSILEKSGVEKNNSQQ